MELFKLLGTIAIDNEQANAAIDDTAAKAEGANERASSAFAGIGAAALKIGAAVLTTGAALGGAWIAAIENTREYRTHMGMLDAAFQTAGHSSELAKTTYSELNAVLGDSGQATEAAQHLALLADNEQELSAWTDVCTGVFARLGESVPLEELASSSSETAKSGILTGGLVDALIQAGISEEGFQAKLDACSNEQDRQNLILSTLTGEYAKASEQYKTTNKDVLDANRANERLTAAFAELGAVGEPILTAIKTKVSEFVTAAVPKIESLIKKVKDMRKWIKENQNTVDAWAAVIIGAGVAISAFLLVMKWGAIMGAATKAVKACRAAIVLFNAALRANPIGLVVSLLAGLVAAFVYLWNNNKSFRQFWLDLWAKIKNACGSAVSWIKGKFNDFRGVVSNVKARFDEIRKGIAESIDKAREAVRKAIDKIKGFMKFSWSLPKLKMPSIGIKGKFSIDPPSVPKFSIKWNAEGGVLNEPAIFGTLKDGTMLGGGEAGAEAIAPIETLQSYIGAAVKAENETVGRIIIEQNRLMMDFLERIMPHDVMLDSGAMVGALTPAIDMQLADRLTHTMRGNTR